MIPVEDAVVITRQLHTGLDIPEISLLLESPDLGDGQASLVGDGAYLYGIVETGSDHRLFILLSRREDPDLGLVLLDRNLCCPGKADLALMLLWDAATAL